MNVDQLPPPRPLMPPDDAFEAAYASGRRRRLRKLTGAVAGLVAVVVGVVAAAATTVGNSAGPDRVVPIVSPSPVATLKPQPLAYSDRLPTYLPPGVTLAAHGPGPDPIVGNSVYWATYNIAGYANSRDNLGTNIRFTVFDSAASTCGPVRTHPGPTPVPTPASERCASPTWFKPQAAIPDGVAQEIHGRAAHVSGQANGYGAQDIEWHEGTVHYWINSDRKSTPAGASGVPLDQLIKMANSVPVDPAAPPGPKPTGVLDASFDPAILNGIVARYDRAHLMGNVGEGDNSVGIDVAYFGTAGLPYVLDIALYDDVTDPPPDLGDWRLSSPLRQVTVRGVQGREYATKGTETAGLVWHEKHYTVVLSGAFGITDDQLLTVAQHLRITVD